MTRLLHLVLLLFGLAGYVATAPAATELNQDNCRKAITEGLDALRRLPPDRPPRDDESRKRLLTEMERLVESSRRQGLSECQTWGKMMGKAFNQ